MIIPTLALWRRTTVRWIFLPRPPLSKWRLPELWTKLRRCFEITCPFGNRLLARAAQKYAFRAVTARERSDMLFLDSR
jgi:hypothetical protein